MLKKIKFIKEGFTPDIMKPKKFAYLIVEYLSETSLGKMPAPWHYKSWKQYKNKVREIGLDLVELDDAPLYKKLVEEYYLDERKALNFVEESSLFRQDWQNLKSSETIL